MDKDEIIYRDREAQLREEYNALKNHRSRMATADAGCSNAAMQDVEHEIGEVKAEYTALTGRQLTE